MHVRLSVSTIVAAAIALASNLAAAQAPSISHTIPAAVTPGQASDIVLFGGNLAGPTGIWLGMTAESALTPGLDKNGTEAGQVSYRVTTPATVPVGIYGLRLASSGGISNMRLVMVDDLPSIATTAAINRSTRPRKSRCRSPSMELVSPKVTTFIGSMVSPASGSRSRSWHAAWATRSTR